MKRARQSHETRLQIVDLSDKQSKRIISKTIPKELGLALWVKLSRQCHETRLRVIGLPERKCQRTTPKHNTKRVEPSLVSKHGYTKSWDKVANRWFVREAQKTVPKEQSQDLWEKLVRQSSSEVDGCASRKSKAWTYAHFSKLFILPDYELFSRKCNLA